jgi:4-amino-4-deoxy-L-arabinose transferase-like glycosyltransferase
MNNHRWNLGETLKPNRWLLVLLGAALAIHFLILIPALKDSTRLFIWADSILYERIALNILDGNGYSIASAAPYNPNSTIVPGYPIFIAGVYALFGRSPYIVVAIQVILSLGIVLCMFCWAIRKFSLQTSLMVGTFLLLDLCFAFYSTQIMSDVLFLAFFLPALWLVLRVFNAQTPARSGAGAGILFGLATLVRPIGLYFPLLLAFLFLPTVSKRNWGSRLLGYGLFLITHLIFVSPWFLRNKVVFGHFFFSTIHSVNLSHQHAAPIKAALEDKGVDEAERDLEREAYEKYGEPKNEAESFIYPGRESLRYILRHPVPYAGLYLAGFLKALLPVGFGEFLLFHKGHSGEFHNLTPVIHTAFLEGRWGDALRVLYKERIAPTGGVFFIYAAGFLIHLFLIGLALRGFLIKGFRKTLNFLAFLVGFYFLGVAGPVGQPRHFLPLLPLAALLAARALISGMYPTEFKA